MLMDLVDHIQGHLLYPWQLRIVRFPQVNVLPNHLSTCPRWVKSQCGRVKKFFLYIIVCVTCPYILKTGIRTSAIKSSGRTLEVFFFTLTQWCHIGLLHNFYVYFLQDFPEPSSNPTDDAEVTDATDKGMRSPSPDSISQEMSHFKPIRSSPRTPPRRLPGGKVWGRGWNFFSVIHQEFFSLYLKSISSHFQWNILC